jgi:hypothetical protein
MHAEHDASVVSLTMSGSWRGYAAPIIADVLASLPADADEFTARRALRDAYPFGDREHWPYRVWLSEVRIQLARRFRSQHQQATDTLPLFAHEP